MRIKSGSNALTIVRVVYTVGMARNRAPVLLMDPSLDLLRLDNSTWQSSHKSMADCRTGPGVAREEIPSLRLTVWDQQNQKVQYPKLHKDVSADVVVVGAGIAGLSVA
ncbi:unnamed protein product [Sphagnum troendelagicum]|uniref:Uncharacterized protein n=1 Tax=Sphagnum troendelagicum TaxID=128251 RepID=A0ABP0UJ40_9BRYO